MEVVSLMLVTEQIGMGLEWKKDCTDWGANEGNSVDAGQRCGLTKCVRQGDGTI